MTQHYKFTRGLSGYFIRPQSQIKLYVYMLIISSVFLAVIFSVFANEFSDNYHKLHGTFDQENMVSWQAATVTVIQENAGTLLLTVGLYLASLFYVVFKLTHRIYGPMVPIHRFIDAVVEGDYSVRLQLRRKDELKDLSDNLNRLVAALAERHGVPEPQSGIRPIRDDDESPDQSLPKGA